VSSVRLAAPIRSIDDRPLAVDATLTDDLNAYLLSPRD
jgi:4-amino-4-deoxychorismate lyase